MLYFFVLFYYAGMLGVMVSQRASVVIGVLGAFIYISSYALLQLSVIDSGLIYTLSNGLAAIMCLFSLASAFNLGSAIIQIAWVGFSAAGLWRQGELSVAIAFIVFSLIALAVIFFTATNHCRASSD